MEKSDGESGGLSRAGLVGDQSVLNFKNYKVLTFDCYGTLIDWESGILGALRPVLSAHAIDLSDDEILELYSGMEAGAEEGAYIKYREVLNQVAHRIGEGLGFVPTPSELDCLSKSLKRWKPFPDTVRALQALKQSFGLAVISNIDDDLFALSAKYLKVEFDRVITAEQAKAYKPSLHIFKSAVGRIGVAPERILHIAQSIYHDIRPAKTMGLSTVWVNRRTGKKGFGATPSASARPDLEVPDLKTLVSIMGVGQ